ncbi:hypothetical protein J3E68DRAFT_86040 [Trichoderma sp. SZMC 28012]
MSADRNVCSNAFGPNTQIHQGDNHYYSSNALRKAYFVVPFPPNEDIVLRPEIVTKLDELLLPSKEGRYCNAALWGLSGSGKTQIALNYAYRRSHEDPDCDIFWVHADNEASFVQDYQAVARTLGLDPMLKGEELFLEVRKCIESQRKWLLILDNADDVTRFGIGATDHTKSLLKFIPGGPGGTILWTSCDKQIVALVGPHRGIQIPHMSIEEAEKLLSVARDEDIQDHEIQDARLLLQELQWLPLAISQAGSFMWRTSTSINKYLSRLLEGKSRWDTLKKAQHDKHRRPEVSNSILETWNISIRYIEQENPMAYRILHTIAYIDNQNIPLSVILAISARSDELGQKTTRNEDILETVIVRLKEFSFISARKAADYAEPTFDMHKLVQDAIRYTFNTGNVAEENRFAGKALLTLESLFPEEINRETWPLCQKYATHAIEATERAADMLDIVIIASGLLGRVSDYFGECGFLKNAEFTAKKELRLANICSTRMSDIIRIVFPSPYIAQVPDKTQLPVVFQVPLILAMSRLSNIYRLQELFEEAETYALETLAIAEKALGEMHRMTIGCMTLLVRAYHRQDRFKEAEEIAVKQLSSQRATFGEKDPDTIKAMSQLAFIYEEQGLYDKAKELKVQVLAISNETFGESHPFTLDAMWSLSNAYRLTRQYREALELEAKLLSLKKDSHWGEHLKIHDLERLSMVYIRQGQLGQARDLQKRILSLQQNAHGEKHLNTAVAMQNLAIIHLLEKESKDAEELQLKAIAILQETFGDKNEQTISALINAAHIYYTQNLTEKGEEFRQKAISLMQEMYGNNPPRQLWDRIEDTASLSMKPAVRMLQLGRRIEKLNPLIQRRLEQRLSKMHLLRRRLSKRLSSVINILRRQLKQRLLKLTVSMRRLLKHRLSKLRLFQGRTLLQHQLKLRRSIQSHFERCASSLRSRYERRESKLLLWMQCILGRRLLKIFSWSQRLNEVTERQINRYSG